MYPSLFTTAGMKTFAEAVDAERQAQLALGIPLSEIGVAA